MATPEEVERIRLEVFGNLQRGVRGDLDVVRKDIAFLSKRVSDHEHLKGWLDQLAANIARRQQQHAERMEAVERRAESDRRSVKRRQWIKRR